MHQYDYNIISESNGELCIESFEFWGLITIKCIITALFESQMVDLTLAISSFIEELIVNQSASV